MRILKRWSRITFSDGGKHVRGWSFIEIWPLHLRVSVGLHYIYRFPPWLRTLTRKGGMQVWWNEHHLSKVMEVVKEAIKDAERKERLCNTRE